MSAYADTSYLLALYAREAHSAKAAAWLAARPRIRTLPFTQFGELELENAVFGKVFRGELDVGQAQRILARVRHDLEEGVLDRFSPGTAAHYREARKLAALHTARLGCRTLDLLHVAAAVCAGARDFLTLDPRQSGLAKAAGLRVAP